MDGGLFAYGTSGFFGNAIGNANCYAAPQGATGSDIVKIATDILNAKAVTPWPGGSVPYVWGGGHRSVGPSTGTCDGYTGAIKPCPAETTVGVDCSGLT